MANKLFIGNLADSVTEKQVFDRFSKIGRVISVELKKTIDGKTSTGSGFIFMGSDKEADSAASEMNNKVFEGNLIRVVKAHYMDQGNLFYSNNRRNRY